MTSVRVTAAEVAARRRARPTTDDGRAARDPVRQFPGRRDAGRSFAAASAGPRRSESPPRRERRRPRRRGRLVALYDVDTGTFLPRPKGVLVIPGRRAGARAAEERRAGGLRWWGRRATPATQILVSFDRTSMGLYIEDEMRAGELAGDALGAPDRPEAAGPGPRRARRQHRPAIRRAAPPPRRPRPPPLDGCPRTGRIGRGRRLGGRRSRGVARAGRIEIDLSPSAGYGVFCWQARPSCARSPSTHMNDVIDFKTIDEQGPQTYRGHVRRRRRGARPRRGRRVWARVAIDVERAGRAISRASTSPTAPSTFTADLDCSRCAEPYPFANTSAFHVRFRPRPEASAGKRRGRDHRRGRAGRRVLLGAGRFLFAIWLSSRSSSRFR